MRHSFVALFENLAPCEHNQLNKKPTTCGEFTRQGISLPSTFVGFFYF